MREQYRHEIDNIHAPKDLIERTRQQIQTETRKKKKAKRHIWIGTAVAACVCITILGGYIYVGKIQNNVEVQTVVFRESSDWETGLSLGGKQDVEDKQTTKIE